jgi:TolA-binding protein
MFRSSRRCRGWLAVALTAALLSPVGAFAQDATEEKPEVDAAATRQYAAAAALQNRDQFELAAEEWQKFIADHPNDPRLPRGKHYLGVCLLKSGKPEAAEATLDLVLTQHPKYEVLDAVLLYLGIAQYNQAQAGAAERYADAAKTFASLVEKFPQGSQTAQALYYQGECLYAQGDKDGAARLYARVVNDFPQAANVPDAQYALGVALEESGKPAEAAKVYVAFLKKSAEHPLAHEVSLRYGETLFAAGNHAEAAKRFAAAANKEGFASADYAQLRLGAALYEQKQYAEAAKAYEQLGARFAESKHAPQAQLAAGKCWYLADQFDAARGALTKVSGDKGMTSEAAHWIAKSLLREGQAAVALRGLERVLPQATPEWQPQLELDAADALYEIAERRGEAIPRYAQFAEARPDDALAPQALYMAAFTALQLGEHERAASYAGAFQKRYAENTLAADVGAVSAESALQLGRTEDAANAYEQLAARFTDHADRGRWLVRRGLCYFMAGKFDAAEAVLAPLAGKLPDAELSAEAAYLLGASQVERKQYDEAIKTLEPVVAKSAEWRQADETLLALAMAYQGANRAQEARAALQRLANEYPQSTVRDRGMYALAEQAYATQNYEDAARVYRQLLEQFPQSKLAPQTWYGLGWAQLSQGEAEPAVKTFTAMLERYPEHRLAADARYARGAAKQQMKDFSGALADLQAYLEKNPEGAERSAAAFEIGLCQVGLQKHDEAAQTFERLLAADPDFAQAGKVRYELAWALKSSGREKDASEIFKQLAQTQTDGPVAAESWYHVGEGAYSAGDFKEAAKAYFASQQKAGESDLGEKAAHKLAWAYYRMEDFDKAQKAFKFQREKYADGPLAGDARFMEAEVLFKQQKYAEAREAYRQLGKLSSPEFASLAALHGAQCAAQSQEWNESLRMAGEALASQPESAYAAELLYEQAWAQQNLGQQDEALKNYELATEKSGDEVAARARFMIGEICFERQQHGDAIKHFFKVAYGYAFPQWQANALYEAGRCFEVRKQKKQALESYQEIVQKFPESDKVPQAKKRIAELGG